MFLQQNFFLNRESVKDMEDDEFISLKEYRTTKNLYYVNREFLVKMKHALGIIKYILNWDLHKKEVIFHILKILKERIKLTFCHHNSQISHVIFFILLK